MNYYNPYFYNIPISSAPKIGLISRLFGGKSITFSGILTGTQKVLNIANQTIPLVKQVKPVIGNAKTMFKVMSEFKKNDKSSNININKNINKNINTDNNYSNKINNDGPTFFA